MDFYLLDGCHFGFLAKNVETEIPAYDMLASLPAVGCLAIQINRHFKEKVDCF